jgi:hypothetical protein
MSVAREVVYQDPQTQFITNKFLTVSLYQCWGFVLEANVSATSRGNAIVASQCTWFIGLKRLSFKGYRKEKV